AGGSTAYTEVPYIIPAAARAIVNNDLVRIKNILSDNKNKCTDWLCAERKYQPYLVLDGNMKLKKRD
ncbi:hypothetical protein K802_23336, partial [Salmonella enterica subsp. enterica serovar Newport str. SHSN012]